MSKKYPTALERMLQNDGDDVQTVTSLASHKSQSKPIDTSDEITIEKEIFKRTSLSNDTQSQVKQRAPSDSIEIKNKSIPNSPLPSPDVIIEISPFKCVPWKFADRTDAEMGDIEELAKSIQKTGQHEPVLLRPLANANEGIQYEVIFGNRRWRACQLIGLNLKAIVKEISDQDAAIAQKEENENRADISDYSKAIHYQSLIDAGLFNSENQLALKLNIPRSRLNDLMSFNRIPKELISSIPSVHKLSLRTAIKLAILSKDKQVLPILIKMGNDIGQKKITAANIEKKIAFFQAGNANQHAKATPVIGKGGAELFTIRLDSNGAPCIVLHKAARSVIDLEQIKETLRDFIDEAIEKAHKSHHE